MFQAAVVTGTQKVSAESLLINLAVIATLDTDQMANIPDTVRPALTLGSSA